jgi:hypothetical protein
MSNLFQLVTDLSFPAKLLFAPKMGWGYVRVNPPRPESRIGLLDDYLWQYPGA